MLRAALKTMERSGSGTGARVVDIEVVVKVIVAPLWLRCLRGAQRKLILVRFLNLVSQKGIGTEKGLWLAMVRSLLRLVCLGLVGVDVLSCSVRLCVARVLLLAAAVVGGEDRGSVALCRVGPVS